MSRPVNRGLRSAILGAFNKKPIRTIKEINNYLKEELNYSHSYNSTRRLVLLMVNEGLLLEIPKRGDKNQIFYTKAVFSNITRFMDYEGNNVALHEFIQELVESTNPRLIEPNAMKAIKLWMLDVLASSMPDSYSAKGRKIPDHEQLKKKLEEVLTMTRQFHAFVKAFVDSDIWSEVARERLAKEFNETLKQVHAGIVDRVWMEND